MVRHDEPHSAIWRPGDPWQCLEMFWCHMPRVENATSIQWVEARDAVDRPMVHRTAPACLKNDSALNVSSARLRNSDIDATQKYVCKRERGMCVCVNVLGSSPLGICPRLPALW